MRSLTVRSGRTLLSFSADTGLPEALTNADTGREFLSLDARPLFALALTNGRGETSILTGADATVTHVATPTGDPYSSASARIYFNLLGGRNLLVVCDFEAASNHGIVSRISVTNITGDR